MLGVARPFFTKPSPLPRAPAGSLTTRSPEMWLSLWDSVCVAWLCVARTQPCAIRPSLPRIGTLISAPTFAAWRQSRALLGNADLIMRLVSDLFVDSPGFNI